MADFAGIIRRLLTKADTMTASLQDTVTHEAWIGQTVTGSPLFAAPVSRKALVEATTTQVGTADGITLVSAHRISFLRPIPANGAVGREEPIDPRDKLTLADGTTGKVLSAKGLVDPATNKPYFYEVMLG